MKLDALAQNDEPLPVKFTIGATAAAAARLGFTYADTKRKPDAGAIGNAISRVQQIAGQNTAGCYCVSPCSGWCYVNQDCPDAQDGAFWDMKWADCAAYVDEQDSGTPVAEAAWEFSFDPITMHTADDEEVGSAATSIEVGPAIDFMINDVVPVGLFMGVGFNASIGMDGTPPARDAELLPASTCAVSTPRITGVEYLDTENSEGGRYETIRVKFQAFKSTACTDVAKVVVHAFEIRPGAAASQLA